MALFADVARLADELAKEGSRLRNRATIVDALLSVATGGAFVPPDVPPPEAIPVSESLALEAGRFCLYLAGQPFPEADARKLNAGGAILSRALKEVSGADDSAMTAAYRRHGDLGAGAYDLLVAPYGKAPSEATVTLSDVAEAFDTMASARTTKARSAAVEGLLRRATALDAKYLLKLMLGDMRIGVKQSLVEESIAVAATRLGHPALVADVRHAVMLEADLGRAVGRAFAGTLAGARLTLFHPLGFMLASPVETPEEAIERFSPPVKKSDSGQDEEAEALEARGGRRAGTRASRRRGVRRPPGTRASGDAARKRGRAGLCVRRARRSAAFTRRRSFTRGSRVFGRQVRRHTRPDPLRRPGEPRPCGHLLPLTRGHH